MGRKPDFPRLVDLIYEAAADARAWPGAMTAIADALGARAMSFEIVGPDGRKAPFLVAPRTDPQWLRVYGERWSASNILRERGLLRPVGVAYRFDQLLPRDDFAASEFYNEFWAPQSLEFALFTNIAKGREAAAGVGFYRSPDDGRFGSEEERWLGALAPHLRRAVAFNLRLERLEAERDGVAEVLNRCSHGAVVVDADARILFANQAAEALLREGTGLCARAGRLVTGNRSKTAALLALIGGKDGIPGGTLAVPALARTLTVVVLPLRTRSLWLARHQAAIVFVRDPAASALPKREEIRLLFGLTPAQAALAREILCGDGIEAAAGRLGISRATARTHLLECFQRTGTRRQAELVRVILQQVVPLGRGT